MEPHFGLRKRDGNSCSVQVLHTAAALAGAPVRRIEDFLRVKREVIIALSRSLRTYSVRVLRSFGARFQVLRTLDTLAGIRPAGGYRMCETSCSMSAQHFCMQHHEGS